jgi:hypothetical protein
MTSIKRLLLAWICAMLVAATATPQTETTAAEPWSAQVGVTETYESNVQLTSQGGGSLGSLVQGSLNRDWALHRGDLRMGGNLGRGFYREFPSLNYLFYGGSAALSYAITRRLSWTLNDTVSSSYAQDATLLTEAGVVLPKVQTRTYAGSNQFAYALSPSSQIQWGVSASRVAFDSSSFADGSSVGTRLSYSHQVGKSQFIGIAGDYQRQMTLGTVTNIQDLLGTWQRPIGKESGVSVAAGVQAFTLPGVSGYRFSPTGSASVHTRVRRNDTLALSYSNTVQQAFGYGRYLENNNITGSYGLTVSPTFGVDFGYTYGQGSSPLPTAQDLKLIGQTATVNIRYTVMRNLRVTGGYSHFTYIDQPSPTVTSYRLTFGLFYVATWR